MKFSVVLALVFLVVWGISYGQLSFAVKGIVLHSMKSELLEQDTIIGFNSGETLKIRKNIDLEGKYVIIPEGVTIIPAGGQIKNGTLVGNKTKIIGNKVLFENVRITGDWNVENISTDLFTTLDYENSLCDVLALANPNVPNFIEIKDGIYKVSAKSFQAALNVCSNTTLLINGCIKLIPNDFKRCYVLQIKDSENVLIKGRGTVIGDKKEHQGNTGEWGHGINVLSSRNVTIQNISVKNCWGDCIYVGHDCKNVVIKDCTLDNGRRQGISVTSADSVLISGCVISNVNGTRPQYGIDVEPNKGKTVDNIIIENVIVTNCFGGIKSCRLEDAFIGKLTLNNCQVTGTQCNYPIYIRQTDSVVINRCVVNANCKIGIYVMQSGRVKVKGNQIKGHNKVPIRTHSNKSEIIDNKIE